MFNFLENVRKKGSEKKVPKKAPIEQPRVFRWEPFLEPFFRK